MDQIAALAGESYSFGADQFHTDDAVRRQCCGFVQISCIMPSNPRSGIRRRIDVTQDLWWTRLGPLEPTDQVANAGGCASKCRMTFRPKDHGHRLVGAVAKELRAPRSRGARRRT